MNVVTYRGARLVCQGIGARQEHRFDHFAFMGDLQMFDIVANETNALSSYTKVACRKSKGEAVAGVVPVAMVR